LLFTYSSNGQGGWNGLVIKSVLHYMLSAVEKHYFHLDECS